jgi:hypothetical protein
MYASLSLKRLSSLLAISFALALGIALFFRDIPADLGGWLRTVSMTLSSWSLALFLLLGLSGKVSPWRLLWWCIPPLNRWVFPDLNGKWTGTVQSNWSVIESVLHAAETKTMKIGRDELPLIPLKPVEIELQITASLFTFLIKAKLAGVDGTSFSLTERIQKNNRRDRFELFYLYLQNTPEPVATDEDTHAGSARLDIDTKGWTLDGEYWTRRRWRSGLNTAGLLSVKRVDRGALF